MKKINESKEKEPSNWLLFLFMIAILLRYFRRFMLNLTQYFPFSLLPDSLNIHHKNKEINIAWDLIRDEAIRHGMYFKVKEESDDQHFIYVRGKFTYIKKGSIDKLVAKIHDILGDTNFYAQKIDEKNYTLMLAKGSVNEAEKQGKIKSLI